MNACSALKVGCIFEGSGSVMQIKAVNSAVIVGSRNWFLSIITAHKSG
jgi:hypothetical protein